jgi:hypothetical protein
MYQFCEHIIVVFDEYYMREPNTDDIAHLLSINESRGFHVMLGSIDCMHVLLVGKSGPKGVMRGALLYWRLLPHKIFGLGTPSLAWQDHTMISM